MTDFLVLHSHVNSIVSENIPHIYYVLYILLAYRYKLNYTLKLLKSLYVYKNY